MRTVLAVTTLSILFVPAVPADAQVYPERIPSVVRTRLALRESARYRGDQGREEQTERTTKTVRIGASGELDIANIAGDITITRGNNQDVTLDIVKTSRGRTADEARENLGLVQVDVADRSGRAEVRTRYPNSDDRRSGNRRNINVSVAFTITAPQNARIVAKSISGSISVRDIRGEVTAESVSGNVTIANGGRVAAAKSVSGDIQIDGTEIEGGLEASSVSGTVTVRKAKARSLSLSTVSGGVTVEDADCPRVEMQSVSGDVQFTGALAQSGRYELTSHSGEVRLAIAGDTGFELDASSFSGSVRSDLPITQQGSQNDRGRRRSLHGVYGNGSAVLDVSTFSGSIVIAKR